MLKVIFLIIITFMFTGCIFCEPIVETEVVYKEKKVLITPPKATLGLIDIPEPMNYELYMESSMVGRNNMLTLYTIDLLKSLGTANNKIGKISKWVEEQKKIHTDKQR